MSLISCDRYQRYTLWAIIVSAVIGIVTAFLRITGAVTIGASFPWVLFGIAVVYLAVLLVSAAFKERAVVCCASLNALLVGLLGTILLSVVALAFVFAATSVIGAIVFGLLLFFFSLSISTAACFAKCLYGCAE